VRKRERGIREKEGESLVWILEPFQALRNPARARRNRCVLKNLPSVNGGDGIRDDPGEGGVERRGEKAANA